MRLIGPDDALTYALCEAVSLTYDGALSIIFISLAPCVFFSLCECNSPPRALDPHRRQTPWASVTESKVRSRLDGAPHMPRYFFHVIDGKDLPDHVRHGLGEHR